MKKIIYIAAITMFLGTASTYAGTFFTNSNIVAIEKGDKTTKVAEDELPAGVKRVLKTDEYKDWKVDEAYLVQEKDYYKIELKKGDQKQTLNLDKYGNKVSVMES